MLTSPVLFTAQGSLPIFNPQNSAAPPSLWGVGGKASSRFIVEILIVVLYGQDYDRVTAGILGALF
ncbi:MAG: hypothetical protein A3I91_05095 [Candidatus Kerfeldbacteria bacterium RIFCSPLOWO2_02_FULL_42_19]|nr:MAG: hypothetical protein A3I91_05095 [Candidatus Kerfeldbacteria bacterium RIFCSPLOWO2_02_FULL_42_19]